MVLYLVQLVTFTDMFRLPGSNDMARVVTATEIAAGLAQDINRDVIAGLNDWTGASAANVLT